MRWIALLMVLLASSAALGQQEFMCVGEDSSGVVRRMRVDSIGQPQTTLTGTDGGTLAIAGSTTIGTTPVGSRPTTTRDGIVVWAQDTWGDTSALKMDTYGTCLFVSGSRPSGTIAQDNPVMCGGTDGTNAYTFKTDTSGRLNVIGAAADGAAAAGNPVLIGGSDGTNAQTALMDTLGQLKTAIPAASISGATTEVLVDNTTVTAMPTTPLAGRRTVEIQNLGPNPIYCAIGPAVPGPTPVLTKSRMVAAVSGVWKVPVTDAVAVACLAGTADQVTGAATIVTEYK